MSMFYSLKLFFKKIIPREFVLIMHKLRGMAAAFYFGFPAGKLRVIGVAGTKGKTTTTNLITRILERAGHKTVMFSTANIRLAGKESPNMEKLTTPSPFFLQKFLREAAEKGCDCAVLEVSSHALKQYRLYGIDFKTVVITNLMPDHLDYHKDAAEYRDIHLRMIGPKTEAVIINGDEVESRKLKVKSQKCNSKVKIISFGLNSDNDLQGYDIQLNSNCVGFKAEYRGLPSEISSQSEISQGSPCEIIPSNSGFPQSGISQGKDLGDFILNIPGKFNVYNSLAAISLGLSEGIGLDKIKKALICVRGVPGRLENIKVSDAQDFEVIVDYAHSPDSLKNVYEAIKPHVKNHLIAVLGGTGDRDKTYRSRAGVLADQFADIAIITNEDPYSEDPEDIMDQVLSGIKDKILNENLFRILDRKEAIAKAVDLAQKGDTILITGKGSEQFMIWGDKKIPWDDREAAREALRGKFKSY